MAKSTSLIFCGKLLTLIALIVVSYLAIQPSLIPMVDQANDKVKHVLAFATLAGGLSLFWGFRWWCVAAGLLLYGIGIEVAQSFIPGRFASVWDVVADCVGIALGLLVAAAVKISMRFLSTASSKP